MDTAVSTPNAAQRAGTGMEQRSQQLQFRCAACSPSLVLLLDVASRTCSFLSMALATGAADHSDWTSAAQCSAAQTTMAGAWVEQSVKQCQVFVALECSRLLL